jgi:hypothetical protein|tara:strand:+ start:2172 stop:2363 length:192 start_codon:yes stop_codon:yes gene_type:complete
MNDETQLTLLKAKIYDANEALDNMNRILSEVVKVSGLDTEKDITAEDIIDRVKYLASLEDYKE